MQRHLQQGVSHAQSAHVIALVEFKHFARRYRDNRGAIGVFLQEA